MLRSSHEQALSSVVLFLQVNPVSFAHSPEEYLVAIGLQPTKPLSDLKAEMQEGPSDHAQQHAEAAAAAAPLRHVVEDSQGHLASSSGHPDQDHSANPPQAYSWHPDAQRQQTVQYSSHENAPGIKADYSAEAVGEVSTSFKHKVQQQAQGQVQNAAGRPKLPLGSPAKIVPLSSLQQPTTSHQASGQRTISVGMPFMPVGSTTGITRNWPGQFGDSQAMKPFTSAASSHGDSRGAKRASGGGETKGRKRQRHGDRERSVDGDHGSGVP